MELAALRVSQLCPRYQGCENEEGEFGLYSCHGYIESGRACLAHGKNLQILFIHLPVAVWPMASH